MKKARLHSKGFTLIASLLLLLLLSGIAIGLMMMVNTEGKVGGTDLQNNLAYHAAEGGIEKMYSDLSSAIQNSQTPTVAEVCGVNSLAPTMAGVSFPFYQVQPYGTVNCGSTLSAQQAAAPTCPGKATCWGNITSGPNQGLYADIIPLNMTVTASMLGGQEVSMTRQAQIALIPVFQFGMFCDADCSIFPGSAMTFAGPVHANGDFYPYVNTGNTLTFENKIAAFGNIVRTQLPNTFPSDKNGTVNVPTAPNGCVAVPPATTLSNCTQMAAVGTDNGDGSVTGGGSSTAQPTANVSSYWNSFSTGPNSGAAPNNGTNGQVINGNYYVTGASTPQGTGARKLSMPFVNGTNFPYEIIRRPPTGESATAALGQSREYNMAQIRVLLSDDPAEFQNGTGASDAQNVRLANVPQTVSSTVAGQWGVSIPAGNYSAAFGTPSSGTYNLYFASASNAVPIPANCSAATATCTSDDWPYPPAQWTAALAAAAGVTFATPVPANVPLYWNNGPAPTVNLCPPTGVTSASTPTPSLNCATSTVPTPTGSTTNTWTTTYPYYALPNPGIPVESSALTTYNSPYSDSWSLLDGWLRVEYLNNSGQWVPVTQEWLQLGFARGTTAPTANSAGSPATGTKNPINPNAILILQQPADRSTAFALAAEPSATGAPSTGTPPSCKTWNGGHTICTTWTPGVPPQLVSDAGQGGEWAFGVTPTTPSTATTPQSLTEYNWYPINFYDAREGEPRDINWNTLASDNSCTTNGVMNAVEIDVGNLQQWLKNSTSGKLVNSSNQNGYILYFSDRRGMLPSKNAVSSHAAGTKTGDSGLEDTINASSAAGTPTGTLETKMTGQTVSPEDDNGNGLLDNWGAYNLGLGFYGTVASPNSAAPINTLIASTNPKPDPYGTIAANGGNRINSCGRTARKNWVSGARHVLKLVDGSLGNLPLNPNPITFNGVTYNGGFTVASENPVYIQGDYNSNPTDTTWNATPTDKAGMAAAAVIADAVTLLSDSWDDRISMLGNPTLADGNPGDTSPSNYQNRVVNTSGWYRVAIAAGKNMTFTYPTTAFPNQADDTGTDGGIHNFLHLLEDWGTVNNVTENYKGSLASLYYSTYNTGFYKCCTAVYGVPSRNFYFDLDFESPYGLPPGTPMFKDVESLGYRQLFAARGLNGN
ncbi:MAG: hypothetical protein WCC04_02285 [Terriglobales bacterium]